MPVPTFPIDEAYLIGGWAESFLWGCFTILIATTLYAAHGKRKLFTNFTICAIVMIYVLATAHMLLGLTRLIQGFVLYRDTVGPQHYFSDVSVPINLVKDYLYITNLVLGDCVVVWRLYAVWGRDLRVAAVPAALVAFEAVAGYGSCTIETLPNARYGTVAVWGTTMYTTSLVTNILVTATVALRIWYISRHAKRAGLGGVQYSGVLLLIVESGALIAAAKIVEFVLFEFVPGDGLSGLNALYIVYECMPQITGIVPTLIVWAVTHGYTRPHSDDGEVCTTGLAFASSTRCGSMEAPSMATASAEDGTLPTNWSTTTLPCKHEGSVEGGATLV
ncbi:hypothetical protein C8Q78DRAFT_973020 [Trametes maxima]|nr:hypothetical protein C8Q78DRAFT_973020 [Trametes maxima]